LTAMTFRLIEENPKLKSILTDPKWKQVRGVALFLIITLAVHVMWRLWAHNLNYAPITSFMYDAMNAMASIVFTQSVWLINHVLGIPTDIREGQVMWLNNGCGIQITASCSGLKPILQFMILMIIFPGPWKKKLWYIPLGVIIVHFTNLFRVCGMAFTGATIPSHLQFVHDNILKAMFYVVIFGLWWLWVEKLSLAREEKSDKPGKEIPAGGKDH
jgi:exosortase/archaeosortase family protein